MPDSEQKTFGVIVVTYGGVSGVFKMVATREEGYELAEQMLRLKEEQPNAKTTFDPFGMGFGAPLPVSAIKAMVVLGPGEKLSEEVIANAVECATEFHKAIDNARPI